MNDYKKEQANRLALFLFYLPVSWKKPVYLTVAPGVYVTGIIFIRFVNTLLYLLSYLLLNNTKFKNEWQKECGDKRRMLNVKSAVDVHHRAFERFNIRLLARAYSTISFFELV